MIACRHLVFRCKNCISQLQTVLKTISYFHRLCCQPSCSSTVVAVAVAVMPVVALSLYIADFFISRLYCMQYDQLLASCCVSVCPSVTLCIVGKWYILQQKCLNSWIWSAPGTQFYNFQPSTVAYSLKVPPLEALMLVLSGKYLKTIFLPSFFLVCHHDDDTVSMQFCICSWLRHL